MARKVEVGDIRELLGKALDAGELKKRRGKAKRKNARATGNIVNLKLPTVYVRAADGNWHRDVTLRVTLIVLGGCAIAAACILGSVYLLKDLIW